MFLIVGLHQGAARNVLAVWKTPGDAKVLYPTEERGIKKANIFP
jgi:hypothetical protein